MSASKQNLLFVCYNTQIINYDHNTNAAANAF
jgi:hypothetical protein